MCQHFPIFFIPGGNRSNTPGFSAVGQNFQKTGFQVILLILK
jgi:hypothetical protein